MSSAVSAEQLAAAASAVLEPAYTRLEAIASAVAAAHDSARAWTEASVLEVREPFMHLLHEEPAAHGAGFVAAPRSVAGLERFMAWWQLRGGVVRRLRLNFDMHSIDVYDYPEMEWFRRAELGQRRVAYGPYVDYSGSDAYTLTVTVPVCARGAFLGVVGADLFVGLVERQFLDVLRTSEDEAVIVNDERRVVAANAARWVVGSRLPSPASAAALDEPSPFREVAELSGGTGWYVALSRPTSP